MCSPGATHGPVPPAAARRAAAQYSNSPAINVNVATFNRTSVSQPIMFGIDLSYRFGR